MDPVRQAFCDFFVASGHTLVPPASLLPAGDATLLFTNAGMNQFKDVFLGFETRSYTRAISVQPCMRVGGKHNDLDEVGKDGRHLTWFEMLGNWSFGDYGKEGAIRFAWDFVTRHLPLDTQRIYVSVYKNDDESYALWKKIANLPDHRIVRLGDIEAGDEENFWSMGPVGPCGRCTELYYDQGEDRFGPDVVGGKTDRFLEFWNLVFMEYNRDEQGTLTPLPMTSVDTGMGLERVVALIEGKSNVFETSLFAPIISEIATVTGHAYAPETAVPFHVIADHLRSLTFALRDGIAFDRQGRGYVLRRILRRAVLFGQKLGQKTPFLHRLVAATLTSLPAYTTAPKIIERITRDIQKEEDKFFETLERGLHYFADMTDGLTDNVISGAAAFKLHDTFGFPVDLTQIMAEERGLSVDHAGFEAALEEQRARAKGAAHFYDAGGWQTITEGTMVDVPTHTLKTLDVRVLSLREVTAEAPSPLFDVLLDRTPFYAEGGGEKADFGTLSHGATVVSVDNVQKTDRGLVHRVTLISGDAQTLFTPLTWRAEVNTARRRNKAAHHTATHLLHAALHQVVGSDVTQAGSMVDEDMLRFDIRLDRPLNPQERCDIEMMVNQWIQDNHPVTPCTDVPYQEALSMGALAFFEDKYGDTVRVIQIAGVSTELCGGNHVTATGDIGSFYLLSDSALGSGVRRIEAVAGRAAIHHARAALDRLNAMALSLSTSPEQLPARFEKLQEDLRETKKKLKKLSAGNTATLTPTWIGSIAFGDVSDWEDDAIPPLLDTWKQNHPKALIVLVKIDSEKGTLWCAASDDAVASGLHAGNTAKALGQALGSSGGGKPTFARAGFRGADMTLIRQSLINLGL
ncbi:MAG: alanine--tRNA ligase [Alphaproteobacteria bacterium]